MKISRSVKLYLCLSMLALGVSLAGVASSFSAYYYVLGMDAELRSTMVLASDIDGVADGQPKETFGFVVASRWQDIPQGIRSQFAREPVGQYELKKVVSDRSMFRHPEAGYYALLSMNDQGEKRYVAKEFKSFVPKRLCPEDYDQFNEIMLFGLMVFLFFSLSLALAFNALAKPVERLIQWAGSLREGRYDVPEQGFKFKELDNLAQLLSHNIEQAHNSVQREKEFLDYSSHELRTPLATIASNIELLELWNEMDEAKQKSVRHRLERASNTMSALTNTLLWLTKDNYTKLSIETFKLDKLVEEVANENRYLLEGRQTTLSIKTHPQEVHAHQEACRMVLNNMIRNAYQHTTNGSIEITQQGSCVRCLNANEEAMTLSCQDVGFGLGLKLIRKITAAMNWSFTEKKHDFGRSVSVSIN
ncbi:sensor histidine kinase [Ferrimonas sp.]|uniref:sensor histidine kinase n=1 Tax=Ferrimonas sp. TaxID=2080861 RepID=UPI003A8E98AD